MTPGKRTGSISAGNRAAACLVKGSKGATGGSYVAGYVEIERDFTTCAGGLNKKLMVSTN